MTPTSAKGPDLGSIPNSATNFCVPGSTEGGRGLKNSLTGFDPQQGLNYFKYNKIVTHVQPI